VSDEALLAEAAGKSGLVWVRSAGTQRWWPAWHVWHDGAVLVVSGGGEQELPDLAGPVELVLRSKDTGARLLRLPGTAEPLTADDERWPAAAQALATSRLNAPVTPGDLPRRWRDEGARVTRLVASGAALERPDALDDASGAAAPAPSPATTSGWRPWHVRGRGRTRRALRRLRS
jgi:hypothetical protein